MKHLRLSLAASMLMLALTFPAIAGQMHTPVTSPPLPATGQIETPRTVAGHIDCGIATTTGTSTEAIVLNPITETALSFVRSVLSLF